MMAAMSGISIILMIIKRGKPLAYFTAILLFYFLRASVCPVSIIDPSVIEIH